ncbi:hypothetical protein G6F37_008712 [Rhizopus arrhizus]|nr:hypothetical protein G6F38_010939 [Rhizopus arrhizus]KAG1155250.1 hypothetical protein G6F37_008712 [Rhizopus arrhizus]
MSTRFFYEDGQGKIVDEEGNDTMDWDAEPQSFSLKNLTCIKLYCETQEKQQIKENVDLDTAMEDIEESVKKQTKHYNQCSNEQNPSLFITIELSCSTLPNLAI